MASLQNLERVTSSVRRSGEEWFGRRHAWPPPPPLPLEVGHGVTVEVNSTLYFLITVGD